MGTDHHYYELTRKAAGGYLPGYGESVKFPVDEYYKEAENAYRYVQIFPNLIYSSISDK
jgi:hypothetical protein